MEYLTWSTCLSFPRKDKNEHINLYESRVAKSWAKEKGRKRKSGFTLIFMDSRVSALAGKKGRASKRNLNRIWRGTNSYILASNLYPTWPWGRSAWNRGDAPTRKYRIPPPSRPPPKWLNEALRGDLGGLKRALTLRPMHKNALTWGRFAFNSSY